MRRRHFLYTAAAVGGAAALGLPGTAAAAARGGSVAGPPTLTPAGIRFPARSRPLRPGTPAEAGLLAEHVAGITEAAERHMRPGPGGTPASYPGYALLAARDGVVVAHEAGGDALRYASWDEAAKLPVELPPEDRVPMTKSTLFDLASVTKLFTTTVAVQLAETGAIALDEPVAAYLPEFAAADPAKAAVTVRHLLVHRSGLVSWINLYALPDDAARMRAIHTSKLRRVPGSGYEYSDLNMITLAALLSRVTGRPLDALVAERITGPLGMRDTMFTPPAEPAGRTAATEYQPWTGRGMVRGSAHDENAWAFGGVAGHAGLFSTAGDLAVFGQMLCDGGRYGSVRVLSEDSVRSVLVDYSADIGASPRGLGWQVDQRFYMDAMNSPVTAGHTGYTGTSIVVDPVARMVLVLLTNRVHPTRSYGTDSVYRRHAARAFARALPVRPAKGRTAWFAGTADGTLATLTAPLARPLPAPGTAAFDLWYDTERGVGSGRFEYSTDGGATWETAALDLRTGRHHWTVPGAFDGFAGRRWSDARARLPAGTSHVRWAYRLDGDVQGRGVYVDGARVTCGDDTVFQAARPADAARLRADGWELSAD